MFYSLSILLITNFYQLMVEAAGIEPASEDIATKTSTSLVYNLILALPARIDTVRISQPAKVSPG